MERNLNKKQKKYDIPVIIISLGILFGFVAFMALKPEAALNGVNSLLDTIIKYFGSILEVFTLAAVIMSLFFCFSSKWGNVKFGDEEPEYSLFSYVTMMSLAALAGAALYWSFTEWAYYFETPGLGLVPESTKALEASLGYSFFHWGVHGQAIYVIIGLVMAYAFYIRKVPVLQTSSVFCSMLGEKVKPGVKTLLGKIVDILVIFGIIGGLGCTLGLAVPLAGGALNTVFGIKITFVVQIAILLVIAAVFTFTSFIGTKRGMQRLSNFSVILALAILLYTFILGPTDFILKNTINSFGWMLEIMPRASLFTDPVANTGFPEAWTMYFQAFYLNYAALMGIFIAKISKGRTIRELSMATLFGVSVVGWLLFAVDGSFAIFSHINGLTDVVELVNSGVGESGIYQLIGLLPGGKVIIPCALLLVIIGFVASTLDSGSLSLAQTTQVKVEGDGNVNPLMRVFWCVMLTLVPLSIMFVRAEFAAMKKLSIIVSIPFLFVVAFMGIRLVMWLRQDEIDGTLDRYRVVRKKK